MAKKINQTDMMGLCENLKKTYRSVISLEEWIHGTSFYDKELKKMQDKIMNGVVIKFKPQYENTGDPIDIEEISTRIDEV